MTIEKKSLKVINTPYFDGRKRRNCEEIHTDWNRWIFDESTFDSMIQNQQFLPKKPVEVKTRNYNHRREENGVKVA